MLLEAQLICPSGNRSMIQPENFSCTNAVELAAAKISVPELRAATSKLASGLAPRANLVFARWLREIAPPVNQPNVKA